MQETVAYTNRLNIGAIRATVTVPPTAGAAGGRLVADSLRDDLASRLSGMLDQVVDVSSDEVWLIRQMAFEADVNSDWGRDRLAEDIARSFTRSLIRCIRHPDESGVVRFASRTQFLVRFLSDVADGTAWSRWYYHSFAGLRPLPTTAVIRTVLLEDPDQCRDILAACEPAALHRLLNGLDDEDLRVVTDAVSLQGGAGDEDAVGRVAGILSDSSLRLDPERAGVLLLQLCVARMRASGKPIDPGFHRIASGASRLAELLNASPRDFDEIGKALVARRLPSRFDKPDLQPLLDLDGGVVRALVAAVKARFSGLNLANIGNYRHSSDSGRAADTSEAADGSTPFGGAFLLLPILARVEILDRPGRGGEQDPFENDGILRLMILINCLGWDRRREMLRDPLLWKVTGNAAPVDMEDVARRIERFTKTSASEEDWRMWSTRAVETISSDQDVDRIEVVNLKSENELLPAALSRSLDSVAGAILQTFASALNGFERSSADYIRTKFLDLRAGVTEDDNRLIARLSMPPLGYVLSRSGCMNQTFACSWLPGRRIELYRE